MLRLCSVEPCVCNKLFSNCLKSYVKLTEVCMIQYLSLSLSGSRNKITHLILFVFRVHDENFTPHNFVQLRKALAQYFSSSSFVREKYGNKAIKHLFSSMASTCQSNDIDSTPLNLFVIPSKNKDDSPRSQYESYISALWKLRDEVSFYLLYTNTSI